MGAAISATDHHHGTTESLVLDSSDGTNLSIFDQKLCRPSFPTTPPSGSTSTLHEFHASKWSKFKSNNHWTLKSTHQIRGWIFDLTIRNLFVQLATQQRYLRWTDWHGEHQFMQQTRYWWLLAQSWSSKLFRHSHTAKLLWPHVLPCFVKI